ncbi:prepilin peptidase [Butyrivibrio sp. XPD2006]|uniref:prepilin peptidase n=1 Tax=Butyrivibrio sp. XPD2006 TaxID=1280668 RepID=UPI0003FCF51F|nr:A24 family peptidase [Butyrivibrio sp. XPD2006]
MFLTGAVFTDLFKDKIYNAWVVPGLLLGMGTNLIQGQDRFLESILAVGAALLILLPVYFFKGIAAGDVKLFMSAASFLSMQDTLSCILISFLIAGAISVAVIILKRNKQKTIHFAVPILASVLFVVGGVL